MKPPSRRDALLASFAAAGALGAQPAAAAPPEPAKPKSNTLGFVLFPDFETLDVFGPLELWSGMRDYEIIMISEHGGPVKSAQGIATETTAAFQTAPQLAILSIPGGIGTRREVSNPAMLDFLRRQNRGTEWTTSVCTGSAVLAKAGLLDGRKATTNKYAYKWATSQSAAVQWQGRARWVIDGKFVTASGISAGCDMALGLIEQIYGRTSAERTARSAEYVWNSDPHNDPFAIET